jgi:hypothetical protein
MAPYDLQPGRRVQWARGSAGGVRSTRYHGIGKIHVVSAAPWLTVCGRVIGRRSMRWTDGFCDARGDYRVTDADYCAICRAKTEADA